MPGRFHTVRGEGQHCCDGLRPFESRPEGKDATHRLSSPGRQSVAARPGDGDSVQGDPSGQHWQRTIGEVGRMLSSDTVRQSVSHQHLCSRAGHVSRQPYPHIWYVLRFDRIGGGEHCLQCFDTVGWASGRASGCKRLSDELLAWLSVWNEMLVVRWCHCHPIISCFISIKIGLTFLVPAYPGCPRKKPLNGCLSVLCKDSDISFLLSHSKFVDKERMIPTLVVVWLVLASESHCRGINTASTWRPLVDEERMMPGHWLGLVICVSFSALSLLVGLKVKASHTQYRALGPELIR